MITPARLIGERRRATPPVRSAIDCATCSRCDIDDQPQNPLSILRSAVSYPTKVLRAVGAQPVERDQFDTHAFPDDEFGLTPAAFADLGPAVHEAGMAWGAAKAFVHLRRRRQVQ